MVYLRVRSNDRPDPVSRITALWPCPPVADRVAIARAIEMCSVSELTTCTSRIIHRSYEISRDKEG